MRMSSMKNIAVSFTKMSKAHTDAPAHAGAPNSRKCSITSPKAYATNPLMAFCLIFRIPTE